MHRYISTRSSLPVRYTDHQTFYVIFLCSSYKVCDWSMLKLLLDSTCIWMHIPRIAICRKQQVIDVINVKTLLFVLVSELYILYSTSTLARCRNTKTNKRELSFLLMSYPLLFVQQLSLNSQKMPDSRGCCSLLGNVSSSFLLMLESCNLFSCAPLRLAFDLLTICRFSRSCLYLSKFYGRIDFLLLWIFSWTQRTTDKKRLQEACLVPRKVYLINANTAGL